MNVIDKDGLTVKTVDPAYEFKLIDIVTAILVVVLCFGVAGYASVFFGA